MALLLVGKTICNLCGQSIDNEIDAVAFPPFCQNENDPCFQFSDGVFHSRCLDSNGSGREAILRASEWGENVGPGQRRCEVCSEEITDPDDYLFIPYVAGVDHIDFMKFNYKHLHKSHLSRWRLKNEFIELAVSAIESGFWKGEYLQCLIKEVGVSSGPRR